MRVLDVLQYPYICLNNKGFPAFRGKCGQKVALLP